MNGVSFGWRLVDAAIAARRALRVDRIGRARPYLMLAPALALVTLLGVGVLYLIWLSLHDFDTFLFRQGALSLDQYRRLIEPPSGDFYRDVLVRTVAVSVLVTAAAVVVALPVAYALVRTQRALVRALLLLALLVPFLMGEAVRAFGWSLILGREGAVGWLLSAMSLGSRTLLGTNFAIWLGLMQVSVPLAALLILPAMRRVDPALEQAAQTLGARPSRVWRHVVVPLVRPGIAVAAAVVFLLSLAELDLPQILGLGRLPFAANAIRNVYTLQGNLNLGSALSVVLLVTGIVAVLALMRLAVPRRR